MCALLVALFLTADPAPLKDKDGAVWTIQSDDPVEAAPGMGETRNHHISRNGVEVAVVEGKSLRMSNPDIRMNATWTFRIKKGVFEAEDRKSDTVQGKTMSSVTVMRWNGKTLK